VDVGNDFCFVTVNAVENLPLAEHWFSILVPLMYS
jgi:hypothetical protein